MLLTLLATFFGGGLVSSLFAEPLRRWVLRGPRLTIDYDRITGEGFGGLSLTTERPKPGHVYQRQSAVGEGCKAAYLRLRVKNESKRGAELCRAYLERIEQKQPGGEYKTVHHDYLPLRWAFVGAVPIEIVPGLWSQFDLVTVNDQERKLLPCTEPRADIWFETPFVHGSYRFTVAVIAEEIAPKRRTIPLTYKSEWPLQVDE